jgi:hypothetical protein
MSVKIDLISPDKKHLAALLRAVAEMIEESSNETVTVTASIEFNRKKKDC